MKNIGNSSAYRIIDHWDDHVRDYEGNNIRFASDDISIEVLHPGQSLSKRIDVPHKFFRRYQGKTYQGQAVFVNAAGQSHKSKFAINPAAMAKTLLYAEEDVRTHYELQQIPKKLDEIKNEVKRLTSVVSRNDHRS
jgi:hypothetical protein